MIMKKALLSVLVSVSASAISADCAKSLETTASAPRNQARATVEWVRPICWQKNRYIGWPTVCKAANGDLIAVFSGDREDHVCPWGKLQMVRSSDGGETWSDARTIANGALDDRDGGIVLLPDGELLVTYFTSDCYRSLINLRKVWPENHPRVWWKRHDEKISDEARRAALGHFMIRSRDHGRTWTRPERFTARGFAPHGPVRLSDGSLLQYGLRQAPKGYCTILAERSDDGGRTWKTLTECAARAKNLGTGEEALLDEPNVVELPGGRLLGMVRVNSPERIMKQSFSDDGGKTWTPMKSTGICGLPPYLVNLGGERVVAVYGRRLPKPGYGEFAVISDDGGRSWDLENEITLATSHSGDLGYPSTAVLDDGTLITVYYQQRVKGEKPCLMATKWRVTR